MSNEKTILQTLARWQSEHPDFEGFWYGYKGLEHATGLPIKTLRKELKALKTACLVDYEPAFGEGRTLAGWGYFINEFGEKRLEELTNE